MKAKTRSHLPRRFWVERLEERNVLSANPLLNYPLPSDGDVLSAPVNTELLQYIQSLSGGGGALPEFDPAQAFNLHSLPGATKTIYLDFNGHTTTGTSWNDEHDIPNILTPAYDFDEDLINFSEDERFAIFLIWEKVSEDFRPFNVNVTTQDPGLEALRKTSGDTMQLEPVESTDVGQTISDVTTVVSTLDFTDDVTSISDINVTLDISHTFDSDLTVLLVSPGGTVIELFSGVGGNGNNFLDTVLDDQAAIAITDPSAAPPFVGSFKPQEALSGLNGEDPNGTWTLIVQDNASGDEGVLNGWSLTIAGSEFSDEEWGIRVVIGGHENDWYHPEPRITSSGVAGGGFGTIDDTPCFVFAGDFPIFPEAIAEVASHEVGHTMGLAHDSQIWSVADVTDKEGGDPDGPDGEPDDPHNERIFVRYYGGHGYPVFDQLGELVAGNFTTSWGPIMGASLAGLTQWSKGEYYNATNDPEGVEPLQDDLAIITDGHNGFGYREDDHGSSIATATPIVLDAGGNFLDAEGIVEQKHRCRLFLVHRRGTRGANQLRYQSFLQRPQFGRTCPHLQLLRCGALPQQSA